MKVDRKLKAGGVLLHLLRRMRGMLVVRMIMAGVSVLALAVLGAFIADAVMVLPVGIREGLPWLLGLAAVSFIAFAIRRVVRVGELSVARRFETADATLGSAMTNAVQLSRGVPCARNTDVEALLRLQAIDRGRRTSGGLGTWAVERRAMLSLLLVAAVAGAVWLGVWLTYSGLFSAVFPRFSDPRGDHPPFSDLSFAVEPGNAEVAYAGSIEIKARAAGRPVERLFLMARNVGKSVETSEPTRTIMFLSPDGSFFQALANIREHTEYWVSDGRARSHRFTIGIRYTPRITMAECKVAYPEYTGGKVRRLKLLGAGKTGRAAPEGSVLSGEHRIPLDSTVSFRIASNRPLASGRLVLTPVMGGKREEIALRKVGDNKESTCVAGSFKFSGAVAFSLSVEDVDGLVCRNPLRGRFAVLPDERPRLSVLEPGKHAVATPDVSIPIRVRAEDDHAVSEIMWFRNHNRSMDRRRAVDLMPDVKGSSKRVRAETSLDFKDLGVRPGDSISYFFEAVDNDPRGPNVATSRVYRIDIISVEQYTRILRMMAARRALFGAYDQLGSWLGRLAERGEELARDPNAKSAPAEMKRLVKDIDEYREALAKILKQPDMFDLDKSFKTSLREQARKLKQLSASLKKALADGDMAAAARLASSLQEQSRTEQREIGEPARHVKSVVDLLSNASRFARLTAEQRRLVRLSDRFKIQSGKTSRIERMEMQELAHAERKVGDGVATIGERIPELLRQLPEDAEYDKLRRTATQFLHALQDFEIDKDLGVAADAFGAVNGPAAHSSATAALEKMEQLVAKNDSQGGGAPGFGSVFQPSLADAMSSSVSQILSAMGSGVGGGGGSGSGGGGMFAGDVALYGPNAEMGGGSGSLAGRGDGTGRGEGSGAGSAFRRDSSDAHDPILGRPDASARARLEPDAGFPLRYRTLVGEYFRVIAESLGEE